MDITTLSLILFSGTILLFSCASENQDPSTLESIEEVAEAIDKLVGQAEANSEEQCALLPIGSKPAGGPWGFLVYSEKEMDVEKLQALVDRYNLLDARRNEESDSFSTADVATEPVLKIQNGRCIGEGRYAWNPGEVREKT